jgi:hypothetical protein
MVKVFCRSRARTRAVVKRYSFAGSCIVDCHRVRNVRDMRDVMWVVGQGNLGTRVEGNQ